MTDEEYVAHAREFANNPVHKDRFAVSGAMAAAILRELDRVTQERDKARAVTDCVRADAAAEHNRNVESKLWRSPERTVWVSMTDEERVAYVRSQVLGADTSRGPDAPVSEGHEDRAALLHELDRVTRERDAAHASQAARKRQLDAAFKAGAEAMREACAEHLVCEWSKLSPAAIRNLPLPTPSEAPPTPPCSTCGHLTLNDGRCLNCISLAEDKIGDADLDDGC